MQVVGVTLPSMLRCALLARADKRLLRVGCGRCNGGQAHWSPPAGPVATEIGDPVREWEAEPLVEPVPQAPPAVPATPPTPTPAPPTHVPEREPALVP